MGFRDTTEFQMGRTGEHIVADFFRAKGWFILPSYDYSGEDGNKAPKLQGFDASYVIPDLDAAKDGTRVWVEVKTKSEPVLYRKTNELRHGIDARHFWQYRICQKITGCSVFLVIVELSTRALLCAPLSKLIDKAEAGSGTRWGEKMVFWPRDAFKEIGFVQEMVA